MNPRAKRFRNRVLASLSAGELSRISPHLVPVALPQHKDLLDGKATEAYFLEDGIASVVVTLEEGDTVEVGVIAPPQAEAGEAKEGGALKVSTD